MHISVLNLLKIKKEIELKQLNQKNQTEIIAVSKRFELEQINPLIEFGHTNFGENQSSRSHKANGQILRDKMIKLNSI
jgi:uncharacterized pyridoxal phosphate-containing UPF0001 family protein